MTLEMVHFNQQRDVADAGRLRRCSPRDLVHRASTVACLMGLVLSGIACRLAEHNAANDFAARAGAAKRAIPRLIARTQAEPQNADILDELGSQYWVFGDLDKAELYFRRALTVDREHAGATINLGQVMEQRGHYAEAAELAGCFLAMSTEPSPHRDWAQRLVTLYDEVSDKEPVGDTRGTWARDTTEAVNSLGMRFVRVPGGTFVMGRDGRNEASPAHEVTLDPCWMGQFEVTAEQYNLFLRATNYRGDFRSGSVNAEHPDHPATHVSWRDARAFTMWLSRREQAVYRLPSEAEWEFAARGPEGRMRPWGDADPVPGVHGNWGRIESLFDVESPRLAKVGRSPSGASPFNCHDMVGNATEWCLDEYLPNYYKWSPTTKPFGPLVAGGSTRCQRGSSWRDSAPGFAMDRGSAEENLPYDHFGFRVVREDKGPG